MIEERKNNEENQLDAEQLLSLLNEQQVDAFREEFLALHPYDQAQFFEKVGPDSRQIIYQYLSPKEMAEIFQSIELDDDEYAPFLKEMETMYAADMLSEMYADDAVDVLNELGKDQVASYLTIMDNESAQEIKDLLHYEEYTAGSIMTTYQKIQLYDQP